MLRFLLFTAFLFVSALGFSQSFDTKTYTWDEKPVAYQLTEGEKKLSSVVLSSKRVVEYVASKETGLDKYLTTHSIQVLNDERAVEASNKIYIPINYHSNLENIRARVVMNGKVISEQGLKDVKKLEEKEVQYYLLALEGVGKGALIETITSLKLSDNLYAAEYLQSHNYTRQATFSLITPKFLEFRTKLYNAHVTPQDTLIDEKRHITYKIGPVAAFEEEKYALENANRIRVEYNFEKNLDNLSAQGSKWSDMGELYFERLFRNYDKNARETDKLLKKLSLKGKNTQERAFAIENYLKSSINLVAEADDQPLVSDLLKNKYANLFGITQLLVLGLDRASVPYEILISCAKDGKRFDPEFDSWSYLSEIVLHVKDTKLYITPNNALLRCGYLPSDLLGQDGLAVAVFESGKQKKAITSIRHIPANEMLESIDKHELEVALNEDISKATIQYNREMSDYAGMGVKSIYYYADEKQRKEFIENFITNGVKDIEVSNTRIENTQISDMLQYKAPFKIQATLSTDAYLEKAGDNTLLKIGELIGPQEQIYQEKKRQNPIDMPYAHQYQRIIRVKLPAGYQMDGLEKLKISHEYQDKDGPQFGFTSSYSVEEGILTVSCTEHYNRISFPVEKFEDFRKVINAAADFNKVIIRIRKKG